MTSEKKKKKVTIILYICVCVCVLNTCILLNVIWGLRPSLYRNYSNLAGNHFDANIVVLLCKLCIIALNKNLRKHC